MNQHQLLKLLQFEAAPDVAAAPVQPQLNKKEVLVVELKNKLVAPVVAPVETEAPTETEQVTEAFTETATATETPGGIILVVSKSFFQIQLNMKDASPDLLHIKQQTKLLVNTTVKQTNQRKKFNSQSVNQLVEVNVQFTHTTVFIVKNSRHQLNTLLKMVALL